MICSKCGEDKPEVEFLWDDGHRLGFAKRCKACRSPCPDCKRTGTKRWLCEKHRAEWRGPVFPSFRYGLRGHAVTRFIERVRPDLRPPAARMEMLTLAQTAIETRETPAFVSNRDTRGARHHRGYLVVSEGVVFALSKYGGRGVMISTVLTEALEGQWVDKAHDVCDDVRTGHNEPDTRTGDEDEPTHEREAAG